MGLSLRKPLLGRLVFREGLGLVGAFHKRKATFGATLDRHRRRETAPPLAKNACVAMQQGPCTDRHLFSADRGRNSAILVARKLAQYDGGMAEEETWRKIVNVSGFLQC